MTKEKELTQAVGDAAHFLWLRLALHTVHTILHLYLSIRYHSQQGPTH